MSSFKSKAQQLKAHLSEEISMDNPQQVHIIKQCKHDSSAKHQLSLQQPIIIQKKTIVKSQSQTFKKAKLEEKDTYVRRKVEPWAPINVPPREKRVDIENLPTNAPQQSTNKEIEIQIEKDDKNKDCLKKLFKKLKKLEEELKESEKERTRMGLELENYKGKSKACIDHQKLIAKFQAENYRITVDLDMAKRLLKQREDEIQRLSQRAPKEIIKEVIVEKPVEVIVEVPKLIPGPQRIVQKVVEVPKYIQIERKVPYEVIKQVEKEVIKTITVEVPTIVEKPVYIERPVYIDNPIERERIVEVPVRIEVPVEIPKEVPVYIDKPIVDQEFLRKYQQMENDMRLTVDYNMKLEDENNELRLKMAQLAEGMAILQRHNEEKNRDVEILLYGGRELSGMFSPNQDYSMGSVKYSISSNPHPRII